MHILTASIVLAVCGLLTSFAIVGIIPSIIAFCMSIYCFLQEKTINSVRAIFVSLVGIMVPIIMYFNCYGISLPYDKEEGLGIYKQIIYDNYSNMGFDMSWLKGDDVNEAEMELASSAASSEPEIYYVSDGEMQDHPGYTPHEDTYDSASVEESKDNISEDSLDYKDYPESIFEKLEDIEKEYDTKPASDEIGASDDDMPSYGGLPVGTLIVAQYFREDDHNCNPVLVLQNETGALCRYECVFTARDEDGNELGVSARTSEVVPDGTKFVIEGRFDKQELGGRIPAMYEFSITKRTPYEKDMTNDVSVYTKLSGNSVILAADNLSDIRVKVDAYVLFFDGDELVDCIWLVPHNSGEVCIEPSSIATIKGDAYYHFDRFETYYTAYEAIEEKQDG